MDLGSFTRKLGQLLLAVSVVANCMRFRGQILNNSFMRHIVCFCTLGSVFAVCRVPISARSLLETSVFLLSVSNVIQSLYSS